MNQYTPSIALDALLQHLPTGAAWLPAVAAGVTIVLGLVLLVRGARLVPALVTVTFAGVGLYVGFLISRTYGSAEAPALAAGGILGLVLGLLFVRLWIAGLIAGLLVTLALALYSVNALQGPLAEMGRVQVVTLPTATTNAVSHEPQPWQAVATEYWNYLAEHVPTFRTSFYAIVISAAVAGLLFGLLLPRLSRAVCAATLGTPLLLAAAYALLHGRWPEADPWFDRWGCTLAAILWSVSLVYNLADMLGIRPRKRRAVARPATA